MIPKFDREISVNFFAKQKMSHTRSPDETLASLKRMLLAFGDDGYGDSLKVALQWASLPFRERGIIKTLIGEMHSPGEGLSMLVDTWTEWKNQYTQQTLQIGEVRGMEIGEAIDKARAMRFALTSILETRFGNLPEQLSATLSSVSDCKMLQNLVPSHLPLIHCGH